MKHIKEYPTKEKLRELFDYTENGNLIRRTKVSNNVNIGDEVGVISNGYMSVMINNSAYKIHRLVWIWHNGAIGHNLLVDHKDGRRLNNRIDNLRLSTNSLNQFNRVDKDPVGCTFDKRCGKWSAKIQVNGIRKYLGYYDTKEEASEAYHNAKNIYVKKEV